MMEKEEERQPIRMVCSFINTLRLFNNYTSLFSALSFHRLKFDLKLMKMVFIETGHALNRKWVIKINTNRQKFTIELR